MSRHDIVNVPSSIRNKLLNKAKETKRPFLEVLQYYAMERFLYRLSISAHAQKFFLKGALMFKAWQMAGHRPTMDIDLLGKTINTVENLTNICKDICQQKVLVDDGIIFFSDTVRGQIIQTEADYSGIRLEFRGDLNRAIIAMQIDVGFGDLISPAPNELSYPTILTLPAPQLKGYTAESVIAEKLETMIKRGMLNSRMKDFFDIWTLLKQFSFNSTSLATAIRSTFEQRGTELFPYPECFSEAFATDPAKNAQWNSFLHKNSLDSTPSSLQNVITSISGFLAPILNGLYENNLPNQLWHPTGPWVTRILDKNQSDEL